MSRSVIFEVETFDTSDNDIFANLPDIIRDLRERLDILAKTINVLSEHVEDIRETLEIKEL